MEKWERRKGSIRTLITDGARHFNNTEKKKWVQLRGINHVNTLASDHHNIEMVERCVRYVLQLLRRQQSAQLGRNWWELIPEVEKQMNFSFNREIAMMPKQAKDGGLAVGAAIKRGRE